MLSNLRYLDESLLQIFLVGQPELGQLLAQPDLDPLRQRIIASYHLTALQEEEVRNYVLHRLKVAGWQGIPQFADDCFSLICRETEGVPRKINKLCDRLLWFAFLEEKDEITRDDVVSVIEDMKTEDFGTLKDPIEVLPEGEISSSADELMRPEEKERELDANIIGLHGKVHLVDTAPEPEPWSGETTEGPADDPEPVARTTVLRDDMHPLIKALKRQSDAKAAEKAAVKPVPEPDAGTREQGPRTDQAVAAENPHETLRPTRRKILLLRVSALVVLVLLGTGSWYTYSKGLVAVSDIDRVLTWAGLELGFAAPDRSPALEHLDQVKRGTGPLQRDRDRTQPARLALPATQTTPPAERSEQEPVQDRDKVLVREMALLGKPAAEAVPGQAPEGRQAAAGSGGGAVTSQLPTLATPARQAALPGKTAAETAPAEEGENAPTAARAADRAVTSQVALRVAPERSGDGNLSETAIPTPTSAKVARVQPQANETSGAQATDTTVATSAPQSDADGRIVLRAIGECWVEVRDGSGALILADLLQAGESYQVPKKGNLTLLAGNAGGLQIELDGRKLAPLGAEGTVLRNLALNPESLLKSFGSVQ
jgi:hypothetical protein